MVSYSTVMISTTVGRIFCVFMLIMAANVVGHPNGLSPGVYQHSCPNALSIVKSVVEKAVEKEARMAASLLRLHFHDCFVQGCDGSVLLDDTPTFRGEKTAVPNNNSIRGFDVVDQIKSELEKECPGVVSCADILAIAARDSVVLSGGPEWSVMLGRRDSRSASLSGANQNIPAPNSTLQTLITKFKLQGLNQVDLVALSGGHTIGHSRCTSFRQRLYGKPNLIMEQSYSTGLKSQCPRSGGDNILSNLDVGSPTKFDSHYFQNLQNFKGLLISDEELYANQKDSPNYLTRAVVSAYAKNEKMFFEQFAESMVKMGNIKPLVGNRGEIRKNCGRINLK
ncbi:hypothetical protein SUGI_0762300 [Cryptomeria japonica]|uniref:peroxidase 49-like n=1 Tax=Cryptomeria japonica TaxID=3369 RepID=UPI002414924C|nr:peroxidase 49-like [Cryptomeria japonica]GLJ37514.1 hypothetical protein SUGI_0762300 [Cryptomeria japonica]